MSDLVNAFVLDRLAAAAGSCDRLASTARQAKAIIDRLVQGAPADLEPVATSLARVAEEIRRAAEANRDVAGAALVVQEIGFVEALVLGELDRAAPTAAARVRQQLAAWRAEIDRRIGMAQKGQPPAVSAGDRR